MLEAQTIKSIQKDPTTPKTQLVIVTGLLVLAAIFQSEIPAYLALVIGFVSLAFPVAGNWIVWGWFKLAEGLGWFNSRVLLSIVYYFVVTPIGILFRLFGNDPLFLKETRNSMYNFREHTYKKEDLENPW